MRSVTLRFFSSTPIHKNLPIHIFMRDVSPIFETFQTTIPKAREYLSQFQGGSVTFQSCDETGIGRITINNEGKKNSLTGKMMVDFYDAVEQLSTWTNGKLVVISGEGSDFCSGGNLDFVKQIARPENGVHMCTFMGEVLRRLRAAPLISIADVRGYALGAGAELACSCDIRVAHKESKLGYVQSQLGITPVILGTAKLVELVGRPKAIELLATGKILSAEEAKNLGIVQFTYESDSELEDYLTSRAKNKAVAVLDGKQTFEEKHLAERAVFASVWGGSDHLEAIAKNAKHNK